MKTALVLIDFSESSGFAAKYAVMVAGSLGIQDIVLFHAQQIITQTAAAHIVALEGLDRIKEAEQELEELARELREIDSTIHYRVKLEEAYIANIIESLVSQYKPAFVFMGLSGKSETEKIIIGGNTIRLMKSCSAPLVIVPKKAFGKPKHIIYASDLKSVAETSPSALIEEWKKGFSASLHVVNISAGSARLKTDDIEEIKQLHELFDRDDTEYHYLENSRTVEGLLTFAQDYPDALIVAVAKEHGFFTTLIKGSITEKLASLSRNPLLLVKNEN